MSKITSIVDYIIVKVNDTVKLTGNQTIAGIKTFSSFPITPSLAPTTDYQVANKKYVDDKTVADATSSVKGIDYKGLLAEYTVTGSAVTSIDFSGLDINSHKSYRIELDILGVTPGANIYMFVNGDTTTTNYYMQSVVFNGTGLSGDRHNQPRIGNIGANMSSKFNVNLSIINGKAVYNSISNYRDGSTIEGFMSFGAKVATVTNIAQLTFVAGTANTINVGSKIRIYRGDV